MFSTIIIQDCALSASQVPIPVSLKAPPSFPASAYEFSRKDTHPVPDSWSAKGVFAAQGTLEGLSLWAHIRRSHRSYLFCRSHSATRGSDITSTLPNSILLNHSTQAASHARRGSTNYPNARVFLLPTLTDSSPPPSVNRLTPQTSSFHGVISIALATHMMKMGRVCSGAPLSFFLWTGCQMRYSH